MKQLIPNGEKYAFGFSNAGLTRGHKALLEVSKTQGWIIHDLRRTARSLMSRAGVPGEHAERCLGHAVPIIQRTYDRHTFDLEMQRAYKSLAQLIEQIADPQENVTPISRARG